MSEREEKPYRLLRGPHIIDFLEQVKHDIGIAPRMLDWFLEDITSNLREFPRARGFFQRLGADIVMAPRMLSWLLQDFRHAHEIPRVIADGVLYRTGHDLYKDKDRIVATGKAWSMATKAYCAREAPKLRAWSQQQLAHLHRAASDLFQGAQRQSKELAQRMEPSIPTAMPVQSEVSHGLEPAA